VARLPFNSVLVSHSSYVRAYDRVNFVERLASAAIQTRTRRHARQYSTAQSSIETVLCPLGAFLPKSGETRSLESWVLPPSTPVGSATQAQAKPLVILSRSQIFKRKIHSFPY
jgi:hypothetical protein